MCRPEVKLGWPHLCMYNCSSLVKHAGFIYVHRLSRTDSCLCEPCIFSCVYLRVFAVVTVSVFSYIASCYYDGFIIIVFGTRLG